MPPRRATRRTNVDSNQQSLHELRSNAVSEFWRDATHVRTRADLDEVRQRFHPDFVGRHRGHVLAALDDMNADEYYDAVVAVIDVGGLYNARTIALRGDDLALVRWWIVIGPDVSERLAVSRVENGLVREWVTFDADQLREAYDELDRQWVEFAGGNSTG